MKPPTTSHLEESHRGWIRLPFQAAALCVATMVAQSPHASEYTILQPNPGGMSARPDITSVTRSNLDVILKWNGFAGPYQVEKKSRLDSGMWEPVGSATSLKTLTLPADSGIGFLRVSGGNPPYAGADTCLDCHGQTHASWSATRHAGAFDTLKAVNQHTNASCLVCHTVGFGLPSGFISETATPGFKGVQCESCHGPAGDHAADENNVALRPVLTPSAMMCGGCHDGFHHPTYGEWAETLHGKPDPHVADGFLNPDRAAAESRMKSCGACHSGAVRQAMLNSVPAGYPLVLPGGVEAAETAITCSTCHSAHAGGTANTAQLRNPTSSMTFFSYNTATNTSFAAQYDPNVQVCGQCHNQRGAAPTDTSRPPHHSVQYNLLIGDVGVAKGYVPSTTQQTPHRTLIADQCAHCHTSANPVADPTPANPNDTGHSFAVKLETCTECHDDVATAEDKITTTQADIRQRIQEVKGLLDSWGTTRSPDAIRTKYGTLAWEYNNAGQISNPTGSSTIKGPTSTEQASVPTEIKSARMYLYLVEHDGSYGVHNSRYSRFLLNLAKTNVLTQMSLP